MYHNHDIIIKHFDNGHSLSIVILALCSIFLDCMMIMTMTMIIIIILIYLLFYRWNTGFKL